MRTIATSLIMVLVTTISSVTAFAQMSPYKFAQVYSIAFEELVAGNYQAARPRFEALNAADPEHAQVQYLLAVCDIRTDNRSVRTLTLLKQAVKQYDPYHQHGNVADRTVPAKAWLLLAEVEAGFEQNTAAIEDYRNYMSCIPLASKEHKSEVIERIRQQRQQLAARLQTPSVTHYASLQP